MSAGSQILPAAGLLLTVGEFLLQEGDKAALLIHHTMSSCPACGRVQPEDSSGCVCAHCGHKLAAPGEAGEEAEGAQEAPPQAPSGAPPVCLEEDGLPPPPPLPVPAAGQNTSAADESRGSRSVVRKAGGIVLTQREVKAQSLGLWALMLGLLGLVAFLPLLSSLAAVYLGKKAKEGGAGPLGWASLILGWLGFILYSSVIIAVMMAAVFMAAHHK